MFTPKLQQLERAPQDIMEEMELAEHKELLYTSEVRVQKYLKLYRKK